MGLSMSEQETVITWDRSSDEMILYTADTFLLERLRGLDAYKLVKEYQQDGQVVAAAFVADKKLITIRKGRKVISEEQKRINAENLQKRRQQGLIRRFWVNLPRKIGAKTNRNGKQVTLYAEGFLRGK